MKKRDRICWEQVSCTPEIWITHLRCELHTWDTCHNHISGRLTSSLFKLEEASVELGQSHRAPCHGNKKLCRTGQELDEEHQDEPTHSSHFSYDFSEVLKHRNLPHALLYNRKHWLLWMIINRRLLKGLYSPTEPLKYLHSEGWCAVRTVHCWGSWELAHSTWLCHIYHSSSSAWENRMPQSSWCLICPSRSFANKPPIFFPLRTQLSHHLKCLWAAPTRDWMQLCSAHHSLLEAAEIIHCNRQILSGFFLGFLFFSRNWRWQSKEAANTALIPLPNAIRILVSKKPKTNEMKIRKE